MYACDMKFGKSNIEKEREKRWHLWFAWYPVRLADGRWAWLETLERKLEAGMNGEQWLYIVPPPVSPGDVVEMIRDPWDEHAFHKGELRTISHIDEWIHFKVEPRDNEVPRMWTADNFLQYWKKV